MRKLSKSGHLSSRYSDVMVLDEPGQGGACHEYYISRAEDSDIVPAGEFGHVRFQNGPVKEVGVNGCHQEDLLAIVVDRLECFQAGPFACRENALALTKINEAIHWLNHRTAGRIVRGVEGTNKR